MPALGWTTWTVGAVDYNRVNCIMPQMMDSVSTVEVIHSGFKSLNNWTVAFLDYWQLQILRDIDTDGVKQLAMLVDPYAYKDRYGHTLVNYNGMSNDEFFFLDNSWHYMKGLKDTPVPNYFNIATNCGHDFKCSMQEMMQSSAPLYYAFYTGQKLPKVSWSRRGGENKGKIEFRYFDEQGDKAKTFNKTKVWSAVSAPDNLRDFRKTGIDTSCLNPRNNCEVTKNWLEDGFVRFSETNTDTFYNEKEKYFATDFVFYKDDYIKSSSDESDGINFAAFYLEVEFPGPFDQNNFNFNSLNNTFRLTSEAAIIPEAKSFNDCNIHSDCQQLLTVH